MPIIPIERCRRAATGPAHCSRPVVSLVLSRPIRWHSAHASASIPTSCVGRVTENHPQAPWRTCQVGSGCSGSALSPFGRCLRHLDGYKLKLAIKRAKTKGLDVRGVTIAPSLLKSIFDGLDQTVDGAVIVPRARFNSAKFTGPAGFDRATFNGHATFEGAKFHEEARFGRATFKGDARFVGATFIGNAGFDKVAFKGNAGFDWATFYGDAAFDEAIFSEDARFGGVKVSGQLSLQSVHAEKKLRLALSTDGTGMVNLARASLAGRNCQYLWMRSFRQRRLARHR